MLIFPKSKEHRVNNIQGELNTTWSRDKAYSKQVSTHPACLGTIDSQRLYFQIILCPA